MTKRTIPEAIKRRQQELRREARSSEKGRANRLRAEANKLGRLYTAKTLSKHQLRQRSSLARQLERGETPSIQRSRGHRPQEHLQRRTSKADLVERVRLYLEGLFPGGNFDGLAGLNARGLRRILRTDAGGVRQLASLPPDDFGAEFGDEYLNDDWPDSETTNPLWYHGYQAVYGLAA